MKNAIKILGLIVLCFLVLSVFSPISEAVYVKGYYRKDGTYVRPHTRSSPNGLKYDNYSWTPSQGLYNETYGTRGSTWDTPTWETQTDYWEGYQQYEESNNDYVHEGYEAYGGIFNMGTDGTYTSNGIINLGSDSTSPFTFTQYNTHNCPENSFYDSLNDKCKCVYGYAAYFAKNKCVVIPENAHAVETSANAWECDYGFVEKNNECFKETAGTTYQFNDCNNGYVKNYSTGTCDSSYNSAKLSNSFIHIYPATSYKRDDKGAYYITGTTSDDCYLIEAIAFHPKTKAKDEYFLKTYFLGDTDFKYGLREDWDNLKTGVNYYRFNAYCEEGKKRASTVIIFK